MSDLNRRVYIAAETTYSTDPDADGSDYLPLAVMNRPYPANVPRLEDTNFAHGGDGPSGQVVTRSGASLDLEVGLTGYATASGDAAAVPTADVFDVLLNSALGTAIDSFGGEGVTTGSTTSNLVLDASLAGLEANSLLPLYVNASNRVHWRSLVSAAGAPTYTVSPDWSTAPLTADVLYGSRAYGQVRSFGTQGSTLTAFVDVSTTLHRLTGGRPTSLSISAVAGNLIKASTKIMFDDWATGATAASLPAITTFPSTAQAIYSTFMWAGTAYSIKSATLDFGIQATEEESTEGNGRSGHQTITVNPMLTIEPLYAPSTWHGAFNNMTQGAALLQMGPGQLTSGRLNSCAFYAPICQVVGVNETNDNGIIRHSVQIRVLDAGDTTTRRWVFARC